MPTSYNFIQNGLTYRFDDVFVPADMFRVGNLWSWGSGGSGRLGNSDTTSRSTPITTFSGGTNWKQVSAGSSHTAAIKIDGTLWLWGNCTYGRLGNGLTTGSISTPITTFAGGTDWKQVSCANQYVSAIKTDGTLWIWGQGTNGRLGTGVSTGSISTPVTTFAGGSNWKQVSTGGFHTVAIKTDGTLWTWGGTANGQLGIDYNFMVGYRSTPVTTFAGGNNWADTPTTNSEDLYTINAANNHMAAIKTDGTLWTWGDGGLGRLGNATTTDRSTPITTFSGGTNWKQVELGNAHSSAIKTDGTLWSWGSTSVGRLGNGIITGNISTPITTFAGGTDWKQVSVGFSHSIAIKVDGTLWAWSFGANGILGNGNTTDRSTPVTTFAGGTNWKQVSAGAGSLSSAAIKTDGTLWVWGTCSLSRLGNGLTTGVISTPITTFAGGTDWKQVSSGNVHTAAIKTDGTLWTWGSGPNGQLGNSSTLDMSTPVTTFAGGTNWSQVYCGSSHTVAIKTDGTLWTWGRGESGRLGNASTTNVSTPVTTFLGGTNWKQASCGYSTIALSDDGVNRQIFTWGIGAEGLLGIFSTDFIITPVTTFAGGTDWKQVSSGSGHTAAIKTDGTLWTWGAGSNGQLGNSTTTIAYTPTTTFVGGTDWKQVTSSDVQSAAIKTDGTLWTWGRGESGRLGNASTINVSTPVTTFSGGSNWKQVSFGYFHSVAIKTDGTLWTWGDAGNGRLGTNDTTSFRSTPVTTFLGGNNWKYVDNWGYITCAITYDDPAI